MRWIAENPPALGPGWEPYPLSRRILNWVKLFEHPPIPIVQSLSTQADYLARTLEFHLLANHLFVNAVALTSAGCFFERDDWLRRGVHILSKEVNEQILSDGGHYERSPMYHSLILEDLLDLMNLRRCYGPIVPDWSHIIARMLSWNANMTHPDGEISFFNDATFGVAPPRSLLMRYAAELGIQPVSAPLGQSGYVRLSNAEIVLLFDAAAVGPDYQPGHAHADTLSFELSYRGQRIVVNSGTSTYENTSLRHRQRGTAAHNTLRLDHLDSSEVWAAFRVGARAVPFDVKTDHLSWAEASHDGYSPVIHCRRIELHGDEVVVTDRVHGPGTHLIEIFFHLYPGIQPDCIVLDPKLQRHVNSTEYCPRFDERLTTQTVRGAAHLDTSLGYSFTTLIDLKRLDKAGHHSFDLSHHLSQ